MWVLSWVYLHVHVQAQYVNNCPFITLIPKPGGYINWRFGMARSRIWLLRRPIGERESLHHVAAVVGSSASLRKSLLLTERRCGVIPVQSFRSHIHPELPGLGLIKYLYHVLSFKCIAGNRSWLYSSSPVRKIILYSYRLTAGMWKK